MKTIEELYKEVMSSDELKKEFNKAARSKDGIAAWLKKYDCGATFEDLSAFLKEKSEGELQDDEVEAVAGGKSGENTEIILLSIFVTSICGALAVTSAAKKDTDTKECFKKND